MKDYLQGIATWISQTANLFLLAGNPDQSISSRCYTNRHKKGWNTAYHLVNKLFFWQDDHCYLSFLNDVKFAKHILNLKEKDTLQKIDDLITKG